MHSLGLELGNQRGVILSLMEYIGRWDFSVGIVGPSEALPQFRNQDQIWDTARVEREFRAVAFGAVALPVSSAGLTGTATDAGTVDIRPTLTFDELDLITAAVAAMENDGFAIPGLLEIDETARAFSAFRTCAMEALSPARYDERRDGYRAEFEAQFRAWLPPAPSDLACLADNAKAAVSDVIARAPAAFYPADPAGREAYIRSLADMVSAMADVPEEGCDDPARLSVFGLRRVNQQIAAAETLN